MATFPLKRLEKLVHDDCKFRTLGNENWWNTVVYKAFSEMRLP
jgi:hypothetical protein